MIKETIKVEYIVNRDNGKAGLTYNDVANKGQKSWEVDGIETYHIFNKFTNKGKVSKSEASKYAIANEEAERLFQKRLEIKSDREADTERALELAKLVNGAFWYDEDGKIVDMVTISEKSSHSSWYEGAGELHDVSLYLKQVPASVAEEAQELHSIRKKHQGDDDFDFINTSINYYEVRIADHDNGR